jgi:hypothetical protein
MGPSGRPQKLKIGTATRQLFAIVVDDRDFFALGASIKDLGDKLSLLNKVEDPANVARFRAEFQTIWTSANPL